MVSARRAGFTLVEVVVSLVLLAVAFLGLAAVASLAATSLHSSLTQERTVRHAAGLLDSLTFSNAPGSGSATAAGVRYVWTAPAGAGAEIRVKATSLPDERVLLELTSRRVQVATGGAP